MVRTGKEAVNVALKQTSEAGRGGVGVGVGKMLAVVALAVGGLGWL